MTKNRLLKASTELGQLLLNARKNNGFTQAYVADAIGLSSPQFISNCERGQCKPSPKYQKFIIEKCRIPKQRLINQLLKLEKIRLEKEIGEAVLSS